MQVSPGNLHAKLLLVAPYAGRGEASAREWIGDRTAVLDGAEGSKAPRLARPLRVTTEEKAQ